MSYKREISLIIPVLCIASGCSDKVYDSSVNETAAVMLSIQQAEEDAPGNYIVMFGYDQVHEVSGNGGTLDNIRTGIGKILMCSTPSGMQRNGTIFEIARNDDGMLKTDSEPLFATSGDVHIRPGVINEIVLQPERISKDIIFFISSDRTLSSVSAEFETAGSIDIEYNRFFNASRASVTMTDASGNGKEWSGSARVLGFCDETAEISFQLAGKDSDISCYMLSIPMAALGYNQGMPGSLEIHIQLEGSKSVAHIAMPSGNWQLRIEKVNIDENTSNTR